MAARTAADGGAALPAWVHSQLCSFLNHYSQCTEMRCKVFLAGNQESFSFGMKWASRTTKMTGDKYNPAQVLRWLLAPPPPKSAWRLCLRRRLRLPRDGLLPRQVVQHKGERRGEVV